MAPGTLSNIDSGRCQERKVDVYRYRNRSPHHNYRARHSHAAPALIPAATLGLHIAGRLAEDYLIVPRIMGRAVQLPPDRRPDRRGAIRLLLQEIAIRRLGKSRAAV
jgi:hypothetical protein